MNKLSLTSNVAGLGAAGKGAAKGAALADITNQKKGGIEKSKSLKAKETAVVPKKSCDPMVIDEDVKWEDIDASDYDDPQAVSDYVNEIYEHLMIKEKKDKITPNYLEKQTDINEKMRSILVDWLVEVHRMFKLIPETLFLSVNIIDRYLSLKNVPRDKLQLVGITSMLIASKYEEIYAPESNDFVYISDGAYSKEQILLMEQQILNTLNFNLLHPSPLHFLRRYSKAAGSDYTIHTLCKYLIELMLLDVGFLKFNASEIAAGAVFLARAMTQKSAFWSGTLEHYSTYSAAHVQPIAHEMNEFLKKSQKSSLKALKKKYASSKFGEVSELPVVDL
eukprot:TRINITY_DN39_c0_g1_i2.p1 TRINITY_DN39_c0_g1~~TRINITY_DN39_c0_g1_i2.p1  ORF type:complete len:335 (-),score=54.40 TRINITY_DN39_c0_g1_i2:150-1154(-)